MTNSIEGKSLPNNYPPNNFTSYHSYSTQATEKRKGAFVVVEEEEHAHVCYYNDGKRVSYGSVVQDVVWNEEYVMNSWRIENEEKESKVFQGLLLIVLVAIVAVGLLAILFGVLSASNIDDNAFYLPTSCTVLERYGCSCENEDSNRFLSVINTVSKLFDSTNSHLKQYESANPEPNPYPCPTIRKCVFKTLIHSNNSMDIRTTCVLFPESNYPIGSNTTCYLSEQHSKLVSFTFYSSVNEAMKMIAILFGIIASSLLVVTIFFSICVAGFKLCQRRKIALMRRNLNSAIVL
ncbi:predicted protein [Naegleria gruberi]|uniref:Predicted protein n=1 Tax=Naegleria gruberi TaxID=5762 RepID=D2VC68_NAEGR|nr:uncharacterized protein NAEGRDRAFT_66465 [Naegleria gruberi]EFC45604.1 predicted protein [Naegleria gruberi]|eukprot:XP_002678348.1 predicted protein [Naegleria gruberi strain NEG-M]